MSICQQQAHKFICIVQKNKLTQECHAALCTLTSHRHFQRLKIMSITLWVCLCTRTHTHTNSHSASSSSPSGGGGDDVRLCMFACVSSSAHVCVCVWHSSALHSCFVLIALNESCCGFPRVKEKREWERKKVEGLNRWKRRGGREGRITRGAGGLEKCTWRGFFYVLNQVQCGEGVKICWICLPISLSRLQRIGHCYSVSGTRRERCHMKK